LPPDTGEERVRRAAFGKEAPRGFTEGRNRTGDGAPDGIMATKEEELKTGDGADTISDKVVAVPDKDDNVERVKSIADDNIQ
jgi:hypothetical protein